MLYSMNHIAKLYSAGFVSIRICACISLVLPILWHFSHSTEFVPESCQLPFFFIFHCHCFVHNFSKYHSPCQKTGWKYSNFSWANNFLFHCRILDFLREAASVAEAQDAVLLFSNLFFTFVEKLTFFSLFSQISSSATVLHMSRKYSIFMLPFKPHTIFEHWKQPSFIFRKHLLF